MKLIKLTSAKTLNKIYINTEYIVYFNEYTEKESYYQNSPKIKKTHILVLGHNNGGFDVCETPQKILELIGKE